MHGCQIFAKTWKAGCYLKKELYWCCFSCVTLELFGSCEGLSKQPFVEQKLCTAWKYMCVSVLSLASAQQWSNTTSALTVTADWAGALEPLSRRAAFYQARLVWELFVPGSSDPSKLFRKLKFHKPTSVKPQHGDSWFIVKEKGS